jgi:hypothetical protein
MVRLWYGIIKLWQAYLQHLILVNQ